jgi:cyclopropane-fatty-acyl-phospholipid synthase
MNAIALAERGVLPDWLIRLGIRRLLRQRLRNERRKAADPNDDSKRALARILEQAPVTVDVEAANEQHYEVSAAFYQQALGRRLKYSCGLWPNAATTLDEAEAAMLDLTCRRAELEDGMEVLELGCGWGSATLWMAERYPRSKVLAISNSNGQRRFILDRAKRRGLNNLEVVTRDVAEFNTDRRFDRVVSVEMFEHVRNHGQLLQNISRWLKPSGKLFLHVFCHRELAYLFQDDGRSDWMARHFFTGGMMPSFDWLPTYQNDLRWIRSWQVNGRHYARTCEAWLERLDQNRAAARRAIEGQPSGENPNVVLQRWRMFFMACAELFAFDGGREWFVGHYLFKQQAGRNGKSTGASQTTGVASCIT